MDDGVSKPTSKLSVQDFAAKIKAKYPDYADMDDTELTNKILTKFPDYGDMVDFTPSSTSSPTSTVKPYTNDEIKKQYTNEQIRQIVENTGRSLGLNISSGYRSPEKQQQLYNQGLTAAKGGSSYHNLNQARDFTGTPQQKQQMFDALRKQLGDETFAELFNGQNALKNGRWIRNPEVNPDSHLHVAWGAASNRLVKNRNQQTTTTEQEPSQKDLLTQYLQLRGDDYAKSKELAANVKANTPLPQTDVNTGKTTTPQYTQNQLNAQFDQEAQQKARTLDYYRSLSPENKRATYQNLSFSQQLDDDTRKALGVDHSGFLGQLKEKSFDLLGTLGMGSLDAVTGAVDTLDRIATAIAPNLRGTKEKAKSVQWLEDIAKEGRAWINREGSTPDSFVGNRLKSAAGIAQMFLIKSPSGNALMTFLQSKGEGASDTDAAMNAAKVYGMMKGGELATKGLPEQVTLKRGTSFDISSPGKQYLGRAVVNTAAPLVTDYATGEDTNKGKVLDDIMYGALFGIPGGKPSESRLLKNRQSEINQIVNTVGENSAERRTNLRKQQTREFIKQQAQPIAETTQKLIKKQINPQPVVDMANLVKDGKLATITTEKGSTSEPITTFEDNTGSGTGRVIINETKVDEATKEGGVEHAQDLVNEGVQHEHGHIWVDDNKNTTSGKATMLRWVRDNIVDANDRYELMKRINSGQGFGDRINDQKAKDWEEAFVADMTKAGLLPKKVAGMAPATIEAKNQEITELQKQQQAQTNNQPVQEATMTPQGSGTSVISNEELNRQEVYYKVSKSGQLTYQGKQPDNSSLKGGEAIVAVNKDTRTIRLENGSNDVLNKYKDNILREAIPQEITTTSKPTTKQISPKLQEAITKIRAKLGNAVYNEYTDNGIRNALELKTDIPLKTIVDAGIIQKSANGQWEFTDLVKGVNQVNASTVRENQGVVPTERLGRTEGERTSQQDVHQEGQGEQNSKGTVNESARTQEKVTEPTKPVVDEVTSQEQPTTQEKLVESTQEKPTAEQEEIINNASASSTETNTNIPTYEKEGGNEFKERQTPLTVEEHSYWGGNNRWYTVLPNNDLLQEGNIIVAQKGVDGVREWLKTSEETTPEMVASALISIDKLEAEWSWLRSKGQMEEAANVQMKLNDVSSDLAVRMTKAGQAIQAINLLSHLAPKTAEVAAQKILDSKGKGEKLTQQQTEYIRDLAEKVKISQARVRELEAQITTGQSIKRAEQRAKEPKTNRLFTEEQKSKDIDFIKKYFEIHRGSGGFSDPELLKAYARVGAYYLENGIRAIDAWTKKMVDEFGDSIQPMLNDIKIQAVQLLQEKRKAAREENATKPKDLDIFDQVREELQKRKQAEQQATKQTKKEEKQKFIKQQRDEAKDQKLREKLFKEQQAEEERQRAKLVREKLAQERKQAAEGKRQSTREYIKGKFKPSQWEYDVLEDAKLANARLQTNSSQDKLGDLIDVAADQMRLIGKNDPRTRDIYTEASFAKDMTDNFGEDFTNNRREIIKGAFEKIKDAQSSRREENIKSKIAKANPHMTDDEINDLMEQRKFQQEQATKAKRELALVYEGLDRYSTIKRKIISLTGIPKAIKASFDLSAPLRQGAILTYAHPIMGKDAFLQQVQALFKSEEEFKEFQDRLFADTDFFESRKMGVEYTLAASDRLRTLANAEERFQTDFARRVWGIRHSEQAYVTYLNYQRMHAYKMFKQAMAVDGITPQSAPHEFQAYADFINKATGRGDLGKFTQSSPILNIGFFSARWLASRFQLMNPVYWARMAPESRKYAGQEMLRFMAVAGSLMTAAAAAGKLGVNNVTVGFDPDDDDFMKIRVGNSHIDLSGGFAQEFRDLFRSLVSAKRSWQGANLPTDKGFIQTNVDFIRSKASPVANFILGAATNKSMRYDETMAEHGYKAIKGEQHLKAPNGGQLPFRQRAGWEALDLVTPPLSFSDLYEGWQTDKSTRDLALSVLSLFGAGIQTYKRDPNRDLKLIQDDAKREILRQQADRKYQYKYLNPNR